MKRQKLGVRKRLGQYLFGKIYRQRVKEHKLDTLFWEATMRCNLSCRHCGSDCRVQSTVEDMPAADFLRVVDTITAHVDTHKTFITISGGEVLVRRDLEEVGRELYKREYPWGIVTNGMLLDEKRFRSLLAAGLRSITVSLDGFEQEHNWMRGHPESFARAVRAIKLIVNEPSIVYDVVTCVNSRNFDQMAEFRDFLISMGVKAWRIFTIFPMGRAATDKEMQVTDEQFRDLMEFIVRTRKEGKIKLDYACEGYLGSYETDVRDNFYQCVAGVSIASIRCDGTISGCNSIRARYDQGNIYKDDFMTVWNNRFEKFRNRDWARKGDCASCGEFRHCMGGGMHLRNDDEELILCHLKRLNRCQ